MTVTPLRRCSIRSVRLRGDSVSNSSDSRVCTEVGTRSRSIPVPGIGVTPMTSIGPSSLCATAAEGPPSVKVTATESGEMMNVMIRLIGMRT